MRAVIWQLLQREWQLSWRRPGDVLNPLVFFAMVITLFPLAVGPEPQMLQRMASGVIWVAALLATLLSLDGLFRSDFEDGSLEQWVLSPHPLTLLVLTCCSRRSMWRSTEATLRKPIATMPAI